MPIEKTLKLTVLVFGGLLVCYITEQVFEHREERIASRDDPEPKPKVLAGGAEGDDEGFRDAARRADAQLLQKLAEKNVFDQVQAVPESRYAYQQQQYVSEYQASLERNLESIGTEGLFLMYDIGLKLEDDDLVETYQD